MLIRYFFLILLQRAEYQDQLARKRYDDQLLQQVMPTFYQPQSHFAFIDIIEWCATLDVNGGQWWIQTFLSLGGSGGGLFSFCDFFLPKIRGPPPPPPRGSTTG